MESSNLQIVRKSALSEQGKEDDLRHTTAEERLKMVWQLTVDAYAMRGLNANQPIRKDIVRRTHLRDQ